MKRAVAARALGFWRGKWNLWAFVAAGVMGILVCGYGYAAQSTNLLIEGRGKIFGNTDVRNVEVRVVSKTDGAMEAYNADFSSSSASFYPETNGKNEQIVYAVKTCNYSKTKTFELIGLDEPATALGSLESEITNVLVGDNLTLGTKLGPGECTETMVSFTETKAANTVGAMTLDYSWHEYTGVPFSIEYMQDMTPEVCATTSTRETKQLVDQRDGNKYWVTKMHDGNCWMVQDLDYDGGGTRFTADNIADWNTDKSISSTQYVHNGDNDKGHDSYGSYYSYMSAASVCPTGWRLATGGAGSEWDVLLDVAGLNDISNWSNWWARAEKAPFYLKLSGYADAKGVRFVGETRTGWTSTRSSISANSNTTLALAWGADYKREKYSIGLDDYTFYGESVRCIAKTGNEPQVDELLTIETMQEMTVTVCQNSQEGDSKQLIDTRDNKKYWVTKMPDGKCWMTQNLDYDGGGTRFADGSDMSKWISDERSNPAQYYYNGDNDKGRESDGSYYSYKAAISVCPTGWRLPIGGPNGDYDNLLGGNNLGTSAAARINAIHKAPYYFWSSGYVTNRGMVNYNTEGAYRAARTIDEPVMTIMGFIASKFMAYNSDDERYYGESVRCVYGEPTEEPVDIITVDTMQDLTVEICKNTKLYNTDAERLLRDTRDGHMYWVTKLAKDGNCWMLQNLDYDGGGDVRFDASSDYTQWASTDGTEPSQYYYSGDWNSGNGSYSYGSYYSFAAAQNVCPASWRLPTGGDNGELSALMSGLSVSNLRAAPYYFAYAGWFDYRGIQAGNRQGYLWTSMPSTTNTAYAWGAYYATNGTKEVSYEDLKWFGFSVRCMIPGN